MAVTLYNKGKRKIEVAKGKFLLPEQSGAFTAETAAKLKRLFANELIDQNEAVKIFETPDIEEEAKAEEAKEESQDESKDEEEGAARRGRGHKK